MERRLPSLNALRAFEAAARNGSFRAAGEELCVTQSAISHQVRALEEELGTDLFVRESRKVSLSQCGRRYYPILRDALDRIAEGTDAIRGTGDSNTVTLQVYSTFAIRFLIPRLPDLQQQHPDLRLRLHTSQSDVDFEHDDVDACVLIGRRENPQLRYDYLFSSDLFPVCSPGFLEANQFSEQPESLRSLPLLQVYPSRKDWWVWLQENALEGVNPDGGQQFDSYDLAMNAAIQGLGVGLGIEPFVNRDLDNGLLLEPFPGRRVAHPSDWFLACRMEKAERPAIHAFRQWLLQAVASDMGNAANEQGS